jgi:hypothetical protein
LVSAGWDQIAALVGSGAGVAIAGALVKLAINVSRLEQEVRDHIKSHDHARREVWSPLQRRQVTGHR